MVTGDLASKGYGASRTGTCNAHSTSRCCPWEGLVSTAASRVCLPQSQPTLTHPNTDGRDYDKLAPGRGCRLARNSGPFGEIR